jgi:predicted RND superfamily exporter protein
MYNKTNQMISKEKVLEKEEISKIQDLKDRLKKITEISGVIEVQNYNIQIKKEQLKLSLQGLQQEESLLAKELEDKYGPGTISLDTGEFLPSK